MAEELKPCPFCGGEAKAGRAGGLCWVECSMCGAEAGFTPRPGPSARVWNNRADDQDAARYRYLRDHTHVVIGRSAGRYRATDVLNNVLLTDWMDAHEAAVDAAMEARK